MAAAEEWSEADIFEGEAQGEQADGAAAPLASEGLTLRTPSLRSLHSEATAANSPSAPAPRCVWQLRTAGVLRLPGRPGSHSGRRSERADRLLREEEAKGKKRTLVEELVFALSDEEGESDEEGGEPEQKMRLPPPRLHAWYQARDDFQPPHCLVAQSCPGNAAGGGLPSLAVRSMAGLMNILLALHCGRPAPGAVRALWHAYLSAFLKLPAPWTHPPPLHACCLLDGCVADCCQPALWSLQRPAKAAAADQLHRSRAFSVCARLILRTIATRTACLHGQCFKCRRAC